MEPTIFWAGDSTVTENKIESYPQTGIAQAMDRYLKKGIRLVNLAENGRSTKSFLEEGRFQPVLEQAGPGDYVFLQFGHNDEKIQDPARYTRPFGDYQENLRFMAALARRRGAVPVLITPIARRKFENGVFVPGSHGDYPRAMGELARREGICCLDMTAASEAYLSRLGEAASEKLFMNLDPGESDNPRFAAGQQDNTHLTYGGAVVMAGLLARLMGERPELFRRILWEEAPVTIERNG